MKIRLATQADVEELGELRQELWPDMDCEENRQELTAILGGGTIGTLPMAVFVAEGNEGALLGFIEVGLRSHADGCDEQVPVGYVEGWFVRKSHRRHGIGEQLVVAAEDWARSKGCIEIASDALIENDVSQHAHEALGFEVVDRCVHYRKVL